ncbi:MAG: ketoreductase domain-containing protein, partial [Desulfonatronovibrio sp.]
VEDDDTLPGIAELESAAELRTHFLEQNNAQRLGKTPAQIEKDIQGVLRNRAVRDNLASFSQLGANVEYHALDVRDEKKFGRLIDRIYSRHGRLDAVLHGAGVILDKLIEEKDAQSFDQVFDVKTDSTYILSQYLRQDFLQMIVFFSSTAGRFGNRGQLGALGQSWHGHSGAEQTICQYGHCAHCA